MRVCYAILSSSTDGAVVSQLANALGGAPVFVHHDFSQARRFTLACGPNVVLLKDYVATQWGRWSQAEAIVRLLEAAIDGGRFDYVQLLSETCLPIRPLREFEAYLDENRPDACIGLIRMNGRADDLGTLNYAWRYYARGRFSRRLLGRLAQACRDPRGADVRERPLVGGLSVIAPASGNSAALRAGRLALQTVLRLLRGSHPFRDGYDCHAGSTWFCLSYATTQHVLDQLRTRPELAAAFRDSRSPDEALVHTVVGNAGLRKVRPMNHFISWSERANGPDELTEAHTPALAASRQFFARKFSKSADDALRLRMLALQMPAGRAEAANREAA